MGDVPLAPIEWAVSPAPVAYCVALNTMAQRVSAIAEGRASELIWLLEHPHIYTAGTSAKPQDLLKTGGIPVVSSGRGGQFTYHGPGQLVVYVLLNVRQRFDGDVRAYVCALEQWLINTLSCFHVDSFRREGRVGVWVQHPVEAASENKIAAIGVRISRGISSHGMSLNVAPDLQQYTGIVPCGIRDGGVTSLAELGLSVSPGKVGRTLRTSFQDLFPGAVLIEARDSDADATRKPIGPNEERPAMHCTGPGVKSTSP